MTYAPIQGKCPVCHQDSANTAFQAGAASRDAEIVALNSQVERLQAILARRLIGLCMCKEERNRFREQGRLLRYVVNKAAAHVKPTCNDLYEELMQAIDATEPKENKNEL